MNKSNYYISSFFWSTLAKILNAVLGFISVPLLLGYYGQIEYGILAIATACNGYMHLLDLGMNTGAIKFFSQWKTEGKQTLIYKVARTNITFYFIIACINSLILILLAVFGENIFSVAHEQFIQLRICLFIIAFFSAFSWVTTAFNQLLVADKQMAFTMQIQCVQVILKTLLIFIALWAHLSLSFYFFCFTAILASILIPYAFKCRKDNLIDSLKPSFYWKDFKIVLMFSLSIFALSLFQVTASQSRPILLSMFSYNGAETVSEFKIIEVIPQFIIMIGGTFSSIFLPKTSELIAKKDKVLIEEFAYKWTTLTSVLANILCVPFIFCATEVISAYVGVKFAHLSLWLILWCLTVLVQIHTTPGNALILSYGRTKLLVITSACSCAISMLINIILCSHYGVGSAVIGYFIYVLIVISANYLAYYKNLLGLKRWKMLSCFLIPTICSFVTLFIVSYIPIKQEWFSMFPLRLQYICICSIKSIIWIIPYLLFLSVSGIVNFKSLRIK